MHRLLAIADFKDRFVVPSANRNNTASMLLQGTQGYNLGGGEDMRRRADTIFGGPMNRKIIPLFEEYQRAPAPHRRANNEQLYTCMALPDFRSASLRRHCSLSGRQLATVYFGALQLEESKQ